MVVFCHHKTGLDPVLEEKKQWNKWVLKGRRSWGPLHSVIMKWELSFWISYFNTIGKIMWIIYPATVCRCFLPCTTQSRLSLALPLCSLFSKTENPALILTDRPCIQNSAWVNICTTLFFLADMLSREGGGGVGGVRVGQEGKRCLLAPAPSPPLGLQIGGEAKGLMLQYQRLYPDSTPGRGPLYWVNSERDGKVIGLLW